MKKRVVLDDGSDHPTVFWAYDPGTEWNGWACPRFSIPEAFAVLASLHMEGALDLTEVTTAHPTKDGKSRHVAILVALNMEDSEHWYSEDDPDFPEPVIALGAAAWCWQWLD